MKHLKNKLSLFVKACLLTIASLVIFNPALADHDHKVSKDGSSSLRYQKWKGGSHWPCHTCYSQTGISHREIYLCP